MAGFLTDASRYRELFLILVQRNIKIRYKNSALGFFWTLLGPIFLIVIYALFLRLLKVGTPLSSLITGVITWQFLSMCTSDSLQAIVGNANLVTKAAFPRIILPGAMVAANTVNLLLSMAVLAVYLVFVCAPVTWALAWIPLILLSHVALCLGVALLVSAANVFFRDTEHIMGVILLAWFFLSPVVYEESLVTQNFPAWVHCVFYANPMTGLISAYRVALIGSPPVPAALMTISFAAAWCLLLVGTLVFQKSQPRFGDEL